MAVRRMFAKSVVMCDSFLELPYPTQCLYYALSMVADDDGLVDSYRSVSNMIGTSAAQLQQLQEKQFVAVFDSGVLGIVHWTVNNQIRKDRYTPSRYTREREQLEKIRAGEPVEQPAQIFVQNVVTESVTQGSSEKNRSVQGSKDEDSVPQEAKKSEGSSVGRSEAAGEKISFENVLAMYHRLCPSLQPCVGLNQEQRGQLKALLQELGQEGLQRLFQAAEETPFLRGEGERGWRAGLGWLCEPGNGKRVLAGNYKPWKTAPPKGASGQLGAAELEAIRRCLQED